jgi:hypothetical protein
VDTVQTSEILASEIVNWYPSMLIQETSDREGYFVTAWREIVAPYFLGNLFSLISCHPRMEGAAERDMKEDSESKKDYTISITH